MSLPGFHRWAVFISGTGSNFCAFAENLTAHKVCVVVTSQENAKGVSKARRKGIPVILWRKDRWQELSDQLQTLAIDRILLAGFMKIIPQSFIQNWEGRIFNIHPSLLPQFPGLKSIEKAFEENATLGVTFHQVVTEVDAGPQVFQKPVRRSEELESTEFLVHITEHQLMRKASQL